MRKSSFCKIVVPVLLLAISTISYAQKTRSQLEKERVKNEKKLEQTAKILNETKKEKKASLGQLNALKQKEKIQKTIIRTISKELNLLSSEIGENDLLLSSLKSDLETLKKEYATMVYESAKTSNSYNKLMFLFTSESFNDLRMRINYLEQYTKARKLQVQQINKVSATIQDQLTILTSKKTEQDVLLKNRINEREKLISMERDKESVVKKLASQEDELKKKLKKQRKNIANLNKLIQKKIREEMAKSTPKGSTKMKLTPEEKLLSNKFSGNKGHLIWPVQYGFISLKFGNVWHPKLKGIKINNLGIDIQTKKGAQVRSVFAGKVLAIASVPGMNKMVMVQHGDYFTVYTKITNVFVTTGQMIARKDPIGVAHTQSDGTTEMQFQIWKNSDKLNPELWISK